MTEVSGLGSPRSWSQSFTRCPEMGCCSFCRWLAARFRSDWRCSVRALWSSADSTVADWGRRPRRDTRLCHCTDERAEARRRAKPSPDLYRYPAASPSHQASASLFPVIVPSASSDRDLWRCGRSWDYGMVSHNRVQSHASSGRQRWPDMYGDRVTDQSRQPRTVASAWGVRHHA